MPDFFRKLRLFLHRDRLERDLAEEMRHHLAMKAANAGESDSAAARRQFGNVTSLKEESRAMWTWTFWEQFAQDLRYALRMMAANPLFTAMAALSLALGIGANTAIYSFMDAIMMRALPVQHPEQLAVFDWRPKEPAGRHPQSDRHTAQGYAPRHYQPRTIRYAAFDLFRRGQRCLYEPVRLRLGRKTQHQSSQGQAEIVDAELVSGGYFGGLGVYPAAGRLICEDDDRFGATPVAVISYAWWRRRFAASPAAVGQSILVNGTSFYRSPASPRRIFSASIRDPRQS